MSSGNVTTRSRMKTVNLTVTTASSQTTLYTCPANCRSHVSMLMVTNVAGNNTVRVRFNRAADGSKMAVLGSKNMAAGEYVLFTGAEMVMEPADTITITVTGSASPEVDIMATVEEFFTVPG